MGEITEKEHAEIVAVYHRLRQASGDLVEFMTDSCLWGLIATEVEETTAHALKDRLDHLLDVFKEPPAGALAVMITEEGRIIDRMHHTMAKYKAEIERLEYKIERMERSNDTDSHIMEAMDDVEDIFDDDNRIGMDIHELVLTYAHGKNTVDEVNSVCIRIMMQLEELFAKGEGR